MKKTLKKLGHWSFYSMCLVTIGFALLAFCISCGYIGPIVGRWMTEVIPW